LELESFLQSAYPIEILCLNEHWLSPNDIDVLSIDNYTVASSFCRSKYKHGGVAILIHNSLKLWQSLNTVQYCEELHCEIAGIAFNGCRLYTIYKPPAGNFDLFIEKLEFLLQSIVGNSILSIKNGNDNVRIEDNCLEEELATTPILSEIRTLSLTFVMLMRFFARLNIYYKTFLTRMQCDTTPFTSCCHNVNFCIAFLRQSANNYRHCSFCAQISPVVLKNKQ
jgi:hypothetical protein